MKTNQVIIDRLADALTYYRENKPGPLQQRRFLKDVAVKFGFSQKIMERAVRMMAGVDVSKDLVSLSREPS